MSNSMRIRPVIDAEDAALRRFDKPYTDFADDELVSELLTIERERHRVTEHIRFERKEIAGLNADFGLVIREMQARESLKSAGAVENAPLVSAPAPSQGGRSCFHCGISESRRVPMQPVEGLDGQFECKNVGDCERRLLRQTG